MSLCLPFCKILHACGYNRKITPVKEKTKSPMSSGCFLALHVNVLTAGSHIPGPVVKRKGCWDRGVILYDCGRI